VAGSGISITGTAPQTISTATPYLPLTGGTLTGPLNFSLSAQPNTGIIITTYSGGAVAPNPAVIYQAARGTLAVPTAVQLGDSLGAIVARGYGATGFSPASKAGIAFVAAENWTDAAQGAYINFNVTPAGSITGATYLSLNNFGLTLASGVSLYLAGVTSGNGPRFFGDTTNIGFELGIGNGSYLFYNNTPAVVMSLTAGGNLTVSGGVLTLNNGTSNWIDLGSLGYAPPSFTTRSIGTKLVLFGGIGASAADYALGIEGGTMWSSVPLTTNAFNWYGGTTLAMTLYGTGNLLLHGALTLTNASQVSVVFNNTTPAITTGGLWRWTVGTGGNMNLQVNTAAAGDWSTYNNNLYVTPTGNATFTSSVTIAPPAGSWPTIILQKSGAADASSLYGYKGANPRWQMTLGNQSAESTGNVGSDFGLYRFTDAGAYIDSPFTINRANGGVQLGGNVAINGTTLFFAGVTSGNGPRVYADPTNMVFQLGTSNGSFYWWNNGGGTPMLLTAAGTLIVNNGADVVGAKLIVTRTPSNNNNYWDTTAATFQDARPMAQGVGGGISFEGLYTTAGAWADLGGIQARKFNATSGDFTGTLDIWARGGNVNFLSNGGIGVGLLASISSVACLTINGGVDSVGAKLYVSRTPGASPANWWEIPTAVFQDKRPFATGVGGAIAFECVIDAAGTWCELGGIQGAKANATSGDVTGNLNIWARNGNVTFFSSAAAIGSGVMAWFNTSGLNIVNTLLVMGNGNSGGLRMASNTSGTGYGSFFRNDSTSTYLLLTNNNDAFGSWNNLRPIVVDNATGNVTMSHQVTIGGPFVCNQMLTVANNYPIYGKDTAGTARAMMNFASDNNIWIGDNGRWIVFSAGGAGIIPAASNANYCGSSSNYWYQVYAGSGGFQTGSDRRMKIGIEDLPDCLDLVCQVTPQRFRWRNGPDTLRTHWGFIAQDVGEVLGEDFGGYTPSDPANPRSIAGLAYNELVAVLWKACQEMKARIEALEARVA
jgi:hypothetical protein